jgi:hypothetical protein
LEKRRDLPSSLTSLSLSYLSHPSALIYPLTHCVCARLTTPLWFTDRYTWTG